MGSESNKNEKKSEKGGIAACFAKAANAKKSPPKNKKDESIKDTDSKKKGDEITKFFESESSKKVKTKSPKKKSVKKKKTKKKSTKKKKKKTKKKKGSIKPARKRKRGQMEEENECNLAPIEYDSESSESSHLDNYGLSDDEELEAMITAKPSKRRKIVDSDDEKVYEQQVQIDDDQDIDLNEDENESEKLNKKMKKKELQRIEKEKLLRERKKNFFGKAAGNKLRKKKKRKKITKSYVDANGMFVTEDVWVTDNDEDDKKQSEHVIEPQRQPMDDDDEDVDMKDNKENSVGSGNKNKPKKAAKEKKTKKRKNASITSFFKKK